MKHTIVHPDDIDSIWHEVEPLIKKTSDDLLNEKDIYSFLKDETYTLWIISDENNKIVTAITMTILKYPRDYACKIVTCGGDRMKEWLDDFLEKLELIAKERGCSYIDIDGRCGWSKVLKGFHVDYITLRKKIEGELWEVQQVQ